LFCYTCLTRKALETLTFFSLPGLEKPQQGRRRRRFLSIFPDVNRDSGELSVGYGKESHLSSRRHSASHSSNMHPRILDGRAVPNIDGILHHRKAIA